MPTTEDEARSQYQRVRYAILRDRFGDELSDFAKDFLGHEDASMLGIPDTSLNPLGAQTRQLATPGLYGREPKTSGDTDLLALLSEQGWWGRMQAVNYLAVGVGVCGMRLHVTGEGDAAQIAPRLVHAHDLFVRVDPDNPLHAVEIWELRKRYFRDPRNGDTPRWAYVWDSWALDPEAGPSFRVLRAPGAGAVDRDDPDAQITRYVAPELPNEGLSADTWPDAWSYEDGTPFLPFEFWRASPYLEFFPDHRRALHQGTLRACLNWTAAGRAAWAATGEHVLVGGADHDAISLDTKRGEADRDGTAPGIHRVRVTPQTMTFVPTKDGQALTAHKLGGGAQLEALSAYSNLYGTMLGTIDGISGADALRQHANPTSGAALAISAEDKRAHALQIAPLFRPSDVSAIRKWARILGAAKGREYDGRATISYHTVPLTPSEQADLREDVEWKVGQGLLSPVDGFLAFNPGHTKEDAFEAIVEAEVDKRRIEAEVARRLAAEGLEDVDAADPAADPAAEGPEDADPAADPEGVDALQDTALNGAQVTAAADLVAKVGTGELPKAAVEIMLAEFFNLDAAKVSRMLASVEEGGNAPAPAPAPPPVPDPGDVDPEDDPDPNAE